MEVIDLKGRKGLVVGIANEHSLAWSAAQHFRNAGADLAMTYLNDKAKPFVEPLVREAGTSLFLPCDVADGFAALPTRPNRRPADRSVGHGLARR